METKKIGKSAAFLLAAVLMLSVLTACGKPKVSFVLPEPEFPTIHTNLQLDYIEDQVESISQYGKGTEEKSIPIPIELTWSVQKADDLSVDSYEITISEKQDLSDAQSFTSKTESVKIPNLKVGTEYYWRVKAIIGEKNYESDVATFTTTDECPRNLFVEGVTNVRDIGGWETEDGGRIRQGLVIRCGRLNHSSSETVQVEITEAGAETMLKTLGIKSEIDLRMIEGNEVGSITDSVLEGVRYFPCPMDWDKSNMLTDNTKEIAQVLAIFADEANYPIIFHCNIGTDRTGLIAMLLEALCGMAKEDMVRDYLFSNLGTIGSSRASSTLTSKYFPVIQKQEGETFAEKTYSYLVSIGVPAEQLDSIIRILKETPENN